MSPVSKWVWLFGLLLIVTSQRLPAAGPIAGVSYADSCLLVLTEAQGGLHYRCDGDRRWRSVAALSETFVQGIGKGATEWLLATSRGLLSAPMPAGPWRSVSPQVVNLLLALPAGGQSTWLVHELGSGFGRVSTGGGPNRSWVPIPGLPKALATALAGVQDETAVGFWGSGVYRIRPDGSALSLSAGIENLQVTALLSMENGALLVGSYGGAIHELPPGADTWRKSVGELGVPVTGFTRGDGAVAAATYGRGVWISRDQGRSWRHAGTPAEPRVSGIAVGADGGLWAGTVRGLFRSDDMGASWREVLFDRPDETLRILATGSGEYHALVPHRGLLHSINGCTGWQPVALPGTAHQLAKDAAGRLLVAVAGHGVLVSGDRRADWRALVDGLPAGEVEALRENAAGQVFAVPAPGSEDSPRERRLLSLGTDDRWQEVPTGSSDPFVTDYHSVWNLLFGPSGRAVAYGMQQLLEEREPGVPWEISHFGQMSWDPPGFDTDGGLWSIRQVSSFVRRADESDWRQASPPSDGLFSNFVRSPGSVQVAARRHGGGIGLFEMHPGGRLALLRTALTDVKVNDLAWNDGRLFAATADGLRVSADGGHGWLECWYDNE